MVWYNLFLYSMESRHKEKQFGTDDKIYKTHSKIFKIYSVT